MTDLRMSSELMLPVDAVTQRLAFLGKPGSGKSYAASLMAERMYDAGAQFVILDPVGIHYGLRVDGKGKGLPITVFGGLHGDVPLNPEAGKMMADLVVDRRLTCVLDVSQFEHDSDKARFAAAFASRFFFRKKAAPSAVHVFIEECQEFIPQDVPRGEQQMVHDFVRMTKLGRNFGIGISLISQRPQEINKKALNLTECLFAFQMTGKHERQAIKDWIQAVGADENILTVLPTLAVAHAHVYSPQWLRFSKVIKIGEKRTADVSSTPAVGVAVAQSKPLVKIDIELIRKEMAATIEKAKTEDPKELQRTIADLRRHLAAKAPAPKSVTPAEIQQRIADGVARIMATFKKENERRMRLTASEIRKVGKLIEASVVRCVDMADQLEKALPEMPMSPMHEAVAAMKPIVTPFRDQMTRIDARDRTWHKPSPDGASDLPKGEKLVLAAIAQFDGVDSDQLSVLTGYKRSSRDAYLTRLHGRGFLDRSGGRIVATKEGVIALGPDYEPLPVGDDLRAFWLGRLPAGESSILKILIDKYPRWVDRDQLGDATGYKRSSRDAYVTRMKARRIIEVGRDGVRASEALFG